MYGPAQPLTVPGVYGAVPTAAGAAATGGLVYQETTGAGAPMYTPGAGGLVYQDTAGAGAPVYTPGAGAPMSAVGAGAPLSAVGAGGLVYQDAAYTPGLYVRYTHNSLYIDLIFFKQR